MHCTCTCCASLLIRGRLTQQRGIAPFRQPPSTQQRSCISPANVLYNEIKQSIADSKIQCTKVTFDIFIRKWVSVTVSPKNRKISFKYSWIRIVIRISTEISSFVASCTLHSCQKFHHSSPTNFLSYPTNRKTDCWHYFFTHWESLSAAYKELISLSICPAVTIRAVVSAPWSLSIRAWLVIVYCICILCMHVCQC